MRFDLDDMVEEHPPENGIMCQGSCHARHGMVLTIAQSSHPIPSQHDDILGVYRLLFGFVLHLYVIVGCNCWVDGCCCAWLLVVECQLA